LSVDFFSHDALAERIDAALAHPTAMQPLRSAARATAASQYDLKNVLLPRWERLIADLVHGRLPAELEDAAAAQPARRIARMGRRNISPRKGSKRAWRGT